MFNNLSCKTSFWWNSWQKVWLEFSREIVFFLSFKIWLFSAWSYCCLRSFCFEDYQWDEQQSRLLGRWARYSRAVLDWFCCDTVWYQTMVMSWSGVVTTAQVCSAMITWSEWVKTAAAAFPQFSLINNNWSGKKQTKTDCDWWLRELMTTKSQGRVLSAYQAVF